MEFGRKWDEAFRDSIEALEGVKEAQNRYQNVFQELLEGQFKEGTTTEFQAILNQFCLKSSEDPS